MKHRWSQVKDNAAQPSALRRNHPRSDTLRGALTTRPESTKAADARRSDNSRCDAAGTKALHCQQSRQLIRRQTNDARSTRVRKGRPPQRATPSSQPWIAPAKTRALAAAAEMLPFV